MLILLFSAAIASAQDATPEATPDPSEGYVIPADPEGLDLDTVIATVRDEEITLGEFRQRVRLERFRFYQQVNEFVSQQEQGAQLLNLDDPANPAAGQIRGFLELFMDDWQIGEQVLQIMTRESVYRQEAEARGLTVDDCALMQQWTLDLNLEAPADCTPPAGYEEARQLFVQRAAAYAGFTEEQLDELARARAQRDLVDEAVRAEVSVTDVETVTTRHIRVTDEATANEVYERALAGEDFLDLLVEYSEDTGRGGELQPFGAGQMVAPFEEAAFNAEVGEIVGPVQSEFGYHIIEVLNRERQLRLSGIVLATEDEANTAVRLLNDGQPIAELAQLYSLDPNTRSNGGDLGVVSQGQIPSEEADAALFSAAVGDTVGPFLIQDNYYVFQVTGEEPQITARHILVETEAEAQDILARLSAGEDFAQLAKLSLDTSGGAAGDTLAYYSQGQRRGAWARGEVLDPNSGVRMQDVFPNLVDAAFAAEAGDILPPSQQATLGFFVTQVVEKGTRAATPEEVTAAQDEAVLAWQETNLGDEADIERNDLWRDAVPQDPLPSALGPVLGELDDDVAAIREQVLAERAENSIVNTLGRTIVPEPTEVFELLPEITPEATSEGEATPEATPAGG
ncbi:MAG: peptidylprolyl isomerase [bacterium]|nr:peptidylprolyl isomerase [bacterium]